VMEKVIKGSVEYLEKESKRWVLIGLDTSFSLDR
jgi:hypothetical protein